MRPRYLVGAVALALVAAGCGGGGSGGARGPTTAAPATTAGATATPGSTIACIPSGTSVQITAEDFSFAERCVAAPADTTFTIRFANQDYHVDHNVAIYTEDPFHPLPNPNAKLLFKGAFVIGPKTFTYTVSPLPAGRYFFRCDAHGLTMTGTLVVS